MSAPETSSPPTPDSPPTVLVVDFGAQYAQLIARRIREAHVYSEIVPFDSTVEELKARRPAGLVLSGGPASVYEPGAPAIGPEVFDIGVPVLGICYGQQVMARALGGEVAPTGVREYGRTELHVTSPGVLLAGSPRAPTRSPWPPWRIPNEACTPCSSTRRSPTRREARM